MLARLFLIVQVKASKKVTVAGAVYKQEKEETKVKSVLIDLKMPKLEQIFKAAAIATKRLTIWKIFTRLFCFEQVKASEKL